MIVIHPKNKVVSKVDGPDWALWFSVSLQVSRKKTVEEQLKGKKSESAKMSRELAITEKKMNDKVIADLLLKLFQCKQYRLKAR